jgi:hypothetical protein
MSHEAQKNITYLVRIALIWWFSSKTFSSTTFEEAKTSTAISEKVKIQQSNKDLEKKKKKKNRISSTP